MLIKYRIIGLFFRKQQHNFLYKYSHWEEKEDFFHKLILKIYLFIFSIIKFIGQMDIHQLPKCLSPADSIFKQRLIRLKKHNSILNEPDLITLTKTTTTSSFLSSKKSIERYEYFIYGLSFPTTAHFSSYATELIGKKDKGETAYKIRLCMFDIYQEIDVQVEVSIPGGLEIKGFGVNGQPIVVSSKQYERAYYSSILRSMFPVNYHGTSLIIYHDIQKFDVVAKFIKVFLPFSMINVLEYPLENSSYSCKNIGVELIAHYLKSNRLWKLCDVFESTILELDKQRGIMFGLEVKMLKKDWKGVIKWTAENLLKGSFEPVHEQLKNFQIRALSKLSKSFEVKVIGEQLLHEGLSDIQTWKSILGVYFQNEQETKFLKLLNTSYNFITQEYNTAEIDSIIKLQPIQVDTPTQTTSSVKLSAFPDYCFKFTLEYMNTHPRVKMFMEFLEKSGKEKSTLELLSRIDISEKEKIPFQELLYQYQKQKSWSSLLKLRNQCFWLESDFVAYQQKLKIMSARKEQKSFAYLNQSLSQFEIEGDQTSKQKKKQEQFHEIQDAQEKMDESFDGNFSDDESVSGKSDVGVMQPCSRRIAITKKTYQQKNQFKTVAHTSKILCHFLLEKLFMRLHSDIKLHLDLQKWSAKLVSQNFNELTKQKKELLAIVFIKKGFLHKKMSRNRKCEQCLKFARKLSSSVILSLVCCYSLALLYKQSNNLKGVQFYMIELVKVLWAVGVQKYDVIPAWAKETIPFIVQHRGKNIVKLISSLEGPLKQLIELWLELAEGRK